MKEINNWGIDIFLIDKLSNHRPLTAVAFTIFQVSLALDHSWHVVHNKVTTRFGSFSNAI